MIKRKVSMDLSNGFVCIVCGDLLQGLSDREMQLHVNSCLDHGNSNDKMEVGNQDQEASSILCPICSIDLCLYDILDRQAHINTCCQDSINDDLFDEPISSMHYKRIQKSGGGSNIDDKQWVCFVCSSDMSGKTHQMRVKHLSKCLNISVGQVDNIFKLESSSNGASGPKKPSCLSDSLYNTIHKLDKEISALTNARNQLQRKLDRALVLEGKSVHVSNECKLPELSSAAQMKRSNPAKRKELTSKFQSEDEYTPSTQVLKPSSLLASSKSRHNQKSSSILSLSRQSNPVDSNHTPSHTDKAMPDFKKMDVSELAVEVKKHGLRPGLKSNMVEQLEEIWNYQESQKHQVEENVVPSRKRASQDDDDLAKRKTSNLKIPKVDVEQQLLTFFKENPKIHQSILLFETLDINQVMQDIKSDGIKCSKKDIMAFFDKQGIGYRKIKENK